MAAAAPLQFRPLTVELVVNYFSSVAEGDLGLIARCTEDERCAMCRAGVARPLSGVNCHIIRDSVTFAVALSSFTVVVAVVPRDWLFLYAAPDTEYSTAIVRPTDQDLPFESLLCMIPLGLPMSYDAMPKNMLARTNFWKIVAPHILSYVDVIRDVWSDRRRPIADFVRTYFPPTVTSHRLAMIPLGEIFESDTENPRLDEVLFVLVSNADDTEVSTEDS